MEPVIQARDLGKRYRRYHPDRPRTLHDAVLGGFRRLRGVETFWALRHLDLAIQPGRTVGVLGRNGAGKSTLLRLVGGIGRPDEGAVTTRGRIGAILTLGAGFHGNLTGRENVYLSGTIQGMTRREVDQRFDAIVDFAELAEFIDAPLRVYSSGMRMRLAFAVAVHVEPDVLLIDEVLAVGDLAFQRKCLKRIADFQARGCAILLASHQQEVIRELCDEAIWLESGQPFATGAAGTVLDRYLETAYPLSSAVPVTRRRSAGSQQARSLARTAHRHGTREVEIVDVQILDSHGEPITAIHAGSPITVELGYQVRGPIRSAAFQVYIVRADGLACLDLGKDSAQLGLPSLPDEGRLRVHIGRLDLNHGMHYVNVSCYSFDWRENYDCHEWTYPIEILDTGVEDGVLFAPHAWVVDPRGDR
ncbi:MAG: ABC transporter ATP-binding protein [Pseudomonadota bacterium]